MRPSRLPRLRLGLGTVPGAAADLLAAGLNPNVGGWSLSPGATELELHLMRWMADRFGLPAGGRRPDDERRRGVQLHRAQGRARRARARRRPRRRHRRPAARPLRLAGGPRDDRGGGRHDGDGGAGRALDPHRRRVPHARRRPRAGDRRGRRGRPAAVLRRRHGGHHRHRAPSTRSRRSPTSASGTACGCTSTRPTAGRRHSRRSFGRLLDGIERADTIAFDPHKWLYTPQSSACLLARDPRRCARPSRSTPPTCARTPRCRAAA